MKKFVFIFTLLLSSNLLAQRTLKIDLVEKKGSNFLVVKYKGEKGDYFDPTTLDYRLPNQDKDSFRQINSFDLETSGVLFFMSQTGDSLLYQVWDINAINMKYFEKFDNYLFDYDKWSGFSKRKNKFIIPISINPNVLKLSECIIYRILIRKGMVGNDILWMEEKIFINR